MRKKLPAWFLNLDLRECLLCWLSSCQSRHESAAIDTFGDRFSAKAIRTELRALQATKHIMLMQYDRVMWAIEMRGRNAAQRARERAKRATEKARAA